MYNTFNIQELIVIITLSFLLLVALIALFNLNWLNNAIFRFHSTVERKHSNTRSRPGRFILALYKYPGRVPQVIKHDGWRSGFIVLSSIITTLLVGVIVTVTGVAIYSIGMENNIGMKDLLIIAITLTIVVLIASFLGRGCIVVALLIWAAIMILALVITRL